MQPELVDVTRAPGFGRDQILVDEPAGRAGGSEIVGLDIEAIVEDRGHRPSRMLVRRRDEARRPVRERNRHAELGLSVKHCKPTGARAAHAGRRELTLETVELEGWISESSRHRSLDREDVVAAGAPVELRSWKIERSNVGHQVVETHRGPSLVFQPTSNAPRAA